MSAPRIHLSPASAGSHRDRICDAVGRAIAEGALAPGQRLPSCRALAAQLSVSRSTVFQAYARLIERGLLQARDRSGYAVAPDAPRLAPPDPSPPHPQPAPMPALADLPRPADLPRIDVPRDWSRHPFPFVYAQIDPGSFPLGAWRECMRLALNAARLPLWAGDAGGEDSELLVEQLRHRLLTYRGIQAAPDQILVTAGAQNALYLLAQLFAPARSRVAIEDPGYPEARNAFALSGASLVPIPVDAEGMQVEAIPPDCRLAYLTPSHQFPTTATLSLARRQALIARARETGLLIIEDDYESERNFLRPDLPPIRALAPPESCVYVGSLSKALSPGLRLGYMVADARIIAQARAIRRAMMRNPAPLMQDAMAHFLAQGHQDAHLRALHRRLRRRWQAMQEALAAHLPQAKVGAGQGGSSVWVEGPDLDMDRLLPRLRARGVLIDPGAPFFLDPARAAGRFRLGFGAIETAAIAPGIALLAEEIRALS